MRVFWVLWLWASVAQAATMVYLSDDKLADLATAIVVATVTDVRMEPDPGSNLVLTHARVAVQEWVKGGDRETTSIVVTAVGGVVRRRATLQPGSPRFFVGEKVLLFLATLGATEYRVIAMARGKYHVEAEPRGGQEVVRQDLTGLTQVDPQTGQEIPASLLPAARGKVYLNDLVATLRQHIRAR
jgi:hypothetical protein